MKPSQRTGLIAAVTAPQRMRDAIECIQVSTGGYGEKREDNAGRNTPTDPGTGLGIYRRYI